MSDPFVTKNILKWYDLNKRSLPWRKNVSKEKRQYNTLISEFMLQQTQVATVIPYFNKFVKEIPNIKKLASVDNKKLIKLWEGLGYYSRARNLKKAAQSVIKHFNGVIPDNFDDLKSPDSDFKSSKFSGITPLKFLITDCAVFFKFLALE